MIELSKGQEMLLPTEGGTLRMGLGWDKVANAGPFSTGVRDVDLDASAVQFGGGQLFDLAFYNNPDHPRRLGRAPRRQHDRQR